MKYRFIPPKSMSQRIVRAVVEKNGMLLSEFKAEFIDAAIFETALNNLKQEKAKNLLNSLSPKHFVKIDMTKIQDFLTNYRHT